MINQDLIKYIEINIFPSYEKNDIGHNLEHINYVIRRSFNFAKKIDNINFDMVYVIAAYHDIGHYIDAKNHEKISSDMLVADNNLRNFFTDEQIKIMSEAVYDHRASLNKEPRSIYGKIISSADRNTSVDSILRRSYEYSIKHNPYYSLEKIIDECRNHIIDKFGDNGYATEKMYFEDKEYKQFLVDVSELVSNFICFRNEFLRVNNLKL